MKWIVRFLVFFSISFSLFAQEHEQKPGWYIDFGSGAFLGGDLNRFVKKTPIPVFLGFSTRPSEDKNWGQWTRFTFARRSEGDRSAESYYLGYGLSYARWRPISLFAGYEVLIVLLKEKLGPSETAIVYHDLFLSPKIGTRIPIWVKRWYQVSASMSVSLPKHEFRNAFLTLAIEGAVKL